MNERAKCNYAGCILLLISTMACDSSPIVSAGESAQVLGALASGEAVENSSHSGVQLDLSNSWRSTDLARISVFVQTPSKSGPSACAGVARILGPAGEQIGELPISPDQDLFDGRRLQLTLSAGYLWLEPLLEVDAQCGATQLSLVVKMDRERLLSLPVRSPPQIRRSSYSSRREDLLKEDGQ